MNDLKKYGERESNLELYRIITMLLIVAHHFVVNSGILDLAYDAHWVLIVYFYLYLVHGGKQELIALWWLWDILCVKVISRLRSISN